MSTPDTPSFPERRRILKNALGATLSIGVLGHLSPVKAASVECDVVVVGSGAAGMTAALAAAKRGLSVVVIEKASTFGGSTARSGAGIWIPNNEVILAAGVPDTPVQAAEYLSEVVGSEVEDARQSAYLAKGPEMLSFVMANSPLRFRWMEGYSDYYPELPGGIEMGRSIEPEMFDGNLLGDELINLTPPYIEVPEGLVLYGADYKWLNLAAVHPKGTATAAECVARYAAAILQGINPLTMGQALVGALRVGLVDVGVPVWLDTSLTDFTFAAGGRVSGVQVSRNGIPMQIAARRGVVVGSGGFEHNLAMRLEYQEAPIGTDWTVGASTNTGDGIRAGYRAGAAIDLMDEAWWGPTIPLPEGPYFCLSERTLPGSLMVDNRGKRFVNEAAPYVDVVHTMYEQDVFPAWMIVDQNYRNRYLFKELPPLLPFPLAWYQSGALFKSLTLGGLAEKIGVPGSALRNTVQRFNNFARDGYDLDFQRGESAYDHYYTDPTVHPNSCLGPLWLPPFYAFKIVPGDLGTKGGLRTDAKARVLRNDGSVIPGLYAAGNASGAVMGRSYAGAGSTIGPAMTFGYIAGNDIADSNG